MDDFAGLLDLSLAQWASLAALCCGASIWYAVRQQSFKTWMKWVFSLGLVPVLSLGVAAGVLAFHWALHDVVRLDELIRAGYQLDRTVEDLPFPLNLLEGAMSFADLAAIIVCVPLALLLIWGWHALLLRLEKRYLMARRA